MNAPMTAAVTTRLVESVRQRLGLSRGLCAGQAMIFR